MQNIQTSCNKNVTNEMGVTEDTASAPSNRNRTKQSENSDKEDNVHYGGTIQMQGKNYKQTTRIALVSQP